jgi:hypothetical protein
VLGWHISVYRIAEPNPIAGIRDVVARYRRPRVAQTRAAERERGHTSRFVWEVDDLELVEPSAGMADRQALLGSLIRGKRVAVWQTGMHGLDWIGDLVAREKALELAGGGYPNAYLALARDLVPQILEGPPMANEVWSSGPHDILDFSRWAGKTVIDQTETRLISPEEWLFVEAWDES